ncbi:MAG: hypothetical protein LBL90_13355 [Prevotellaceae bacterium]|jgi:multisubunit Na+/H+ antiporter MnhB subunit|nr:hypothetical protein [Prevotellaceae bacterium]
MDLFVVALCITAIVFTIIVIARQWNGNKEKSALRPFICFTICIIVAIAMLVSIVSEIIPAEPKSYIYILPNQSICGE